MAVIKRGKFNDKGQVPEEKVEKPKFKVGDRVKLKENLEPNLVYGDLQLYRGDMIESLKEARTIVRSYNEEKYYKHYLVEGVNYYYAEEMLELVEDQKVVNLKDNKEEKKVSNRPKVSEHFPKEIEKMKIRVIGFYTKEEYEQIMDKIAQVVDNAKQGFVLLLDGFSFTTRYKKGKVTGVTVRRSTRTITL